MRYSLKKFKRICEFIKEVEECDISDFCNNVIDCFNNVYNSRKDVILSDDDDDGNCLAYFDDENSPQICILTDTKKDKVTVLDAYIA